MHVRRVPVTPSSGEGPSGAAQPAAQRPRCAGIGDETGITWTCWECLLDIAAKRPKMPKYACANDNWMQITTDPEERSRCDCGKPCSQAIQSRGGCTDQCERPCCLPGGHEEEEGQQGHWCLTCYRETYQRKETQSNEPQPRVVPRGSVAARGCPCADCLNGVPPRNPSSPNMDDEYVMRLHAGASDSEGTFVQRTRWRLLARWVLHRWRRLVARRRRLRHARFIRAILTIVRACHREQHLF